MKKAFKGITMATGTVVFLFGLIICACEAPTMEQQIVNFCIGIPVMVVGAVVTWISSRGMEDVLQ